jgi:hypothetical protein
MKGWPFVRDPLNYEGRVNEIWKLPDEGYLLGATFPVVEDEPGRVHVATDQLRGLLKMAGYELQG